MATAPPSRRARRDYGSLLLIPLAIVLLDSYGWFPSDISAQGVQSPPVFVAGQVHSFTPPIVIPNASQQTAAQDPEQTTERPDDLQTALQDPQATGLKAHLTHPAGDLWPVPIHKGQFNLPALKPGHYQLHLTRQGQSIWQMPIHIAPLPRVQSDRYYVQAGDNLSIWRQQPLPEGRYQLIHREHGVMAAGTLAYQAPVPLKIPADAPPGHYRLWIEGEGTTPFQVLAKPESIQVFAPSPYVLSGADQNVTLYVLDAEQQRVETGWVRIGEQSYTVHNGRVRIPIAARNLPHNGAPVIIPFTASVAQGQLFQSELRFEQISGPWLLQSDTPDAESPLLTLVTSNSEIPEQTGLQWSAQQGPHRLQGVLPATTAEQLNNLQDQLMAKLMPHRPVSLHVQDAEGHTQQLTIQWGHLHHASASKTELEITPSRPNALDSLTVSKTAEYPYVVNHYLPQHWAMATSDLQPAETGSGRSGHTESEAPAHQPWRFLWLICGLLIASYPLYRLRKHPHLSLPTQPVKKDLKRAQFGLFMGSALALTALPPLWLHLSHWGMQSYLGGLALSAFALSWGLRKRQLPIHPVWIFTQTALILICLWFSQTYAPETLTSVMIYGVLLHALWLLGFRQWLRSPLQTTSSLILTSLLGVLSLLNAVVAFQQPQNHANTLPRQASSAEKEQNTRVTPQLPVPLYQLRHSSALPARFQLQGEGGTHVVNSLNAQGQWSYQNIQVAYTPTATTEAPPLVLQGDQLQLPVKLHNPTQNTVRLPLRLNTPQGLKNQTVALKAGEHKTVMFPLRFATQGIQNYALSQWYAGRWQTQNWQTFVAPPSQPDTETPEVRFSPLRIEVTYPEQSTAIGGEIPVIVDVQHRLPEDSALSIQLGIPAGFEAITDTLSTERTQAWLADLRNSTQRLNLETRVLRAGQRVRFHYRLKAKFAGNFQTPPAWVSPLENTRQQGFAQSATLQVQP